MHKDILVTIKLLPHILLLKNKKKTLATRLVLIVGSFRKGIANILLITKLLVLFSDKKLVGISRAVYTTRYVYNTEFVEKDLFNQLYVKKLLSVHKSISPSTLYSDFVKVPSK